MRQTTRYAVLAGLLSGCALATGCRCQDHDALATLTEKGGTVQRDHAARVDTWEAAHIGSAFRLGDGIRTRGGATALLTLNEGSSLKLTPNSLVRFLNRRADQEGQGPGIDVETGEAELLVGDEALSLFTSVGMATIASGSRVTLTRVERGILFEVAIGKAIFFDKNNAPREVTAGESIEIDIGAAVLETVPAAAEEHAAATRPPDAEPDTGDARPKADTDTSEAGGDAEQRAGRPTPAPRGDHRPAADIPEGPKRADFSVAPGESFVVHAPDPPVSIAFDVARQCPGGAAIQVGHRWTARDKGIVRAIFDPGRHKYRLRCLAADGSFGQEVAKGRIQVLKDAGLARIPGNPPTSFIETDGRQYKIIYQTRLPSISVRWPQAPKGQSYKLHIDGKRQISTQKPELLLASGKLPEGTHELKFEAIGDLARTSRTTTVEIRFDNAAPKASITEPVNGGFTTGGTIQVKGTAMAGWGIKLLGGTIEKDAQHRFNGTVTPSGSFMSVTLRLSHPRRGVHYYIRRAKGENL